VWNEVLLVMVDMASSSLSSFTLTDSSATRFPDADGPEVDWMWNHVSMLIYLMLTFYAHYLLGFFLRPTICTYIQPAAGVRS
jgi:hypothetical protein